MRRPWQCLTSTDRAAGAQATHRDPVELWRRRAFNLETAVERPREHTTKTCSISVGGVRLGSRGTVFKNSHQRLLGNGRCREPGSLYNADSSPGGFAGICRLCVLFRPNPKQSAQAFAVQPFARPEAANPPGPLKGKSSVRFKRSAARRRKKTCFSFPAKLGYLCCAVKAVQRPDFVVDLAISSAQPGFISTTVSAHAACSLDVVSKRRSQRSKPPSYR